MSEQHLGRGVTFAGFNKYFLFFILLTCLIDDLYYDKTVKDEILLVVKDAVMSFVSTMENKVLLAVKDDNIHMQSRKATGTEVQAVNNGCSLALLAFLWLC